MRDIIREITVNEKLLKISTKYNKILDSLQTLPDRHDNNNYIWLIN